MWLKKASGLMNMLVCRAAQFHQKCWDYISIWLGNNNNDNTRISKENIYNKLRNLTIVIFHCIVLFYSTTVQWPY